MRSHRIWLFLFSCFSFGLSPTVSRACSGLSLDAGSPTVSLTANPQPTLNLTVTRPDHVTSCSFFVTIDYGASSSFATRSLKNASSTIPLQFYKDAAAKRIIKMFPDISSSNDILTGQFNGNALSRSLSYRTKLSVPLSGLLSGLYSDTFTVQLWEGVFWGPHTLRDARTLSFTYQVHAGVDLSLVDTGAPFNVSDTAQSADFGIMSTNAQRQFDMVLMHSAGFKISMSSTNDGRMKHSRLASFVPYTLSVGGSPASLAGSSATPIVVSSGAGISPPGGTRIRVSITLGNVDSLVNGSYSDVVTITATAN